jgi:hypothetical protein
LTSLGKIRVVQYGLGPVGMEIVETLLTRPWVELVGAVDIDAAKVGKDIGQFLEKPRHIGVTISDRPDDVLNRTKSHVVTHATSTHMRAIYPQIEMILEHGTSVISTAEELTYPFVKYPETAQKLDALAKSRKKIVLGTGVNPGFLLDTLAVVLSGVCQHVNSIRAERVVDAARRRLRLQRKIGAGLTPDEFDRKVADGTVKHVGLPESVGLISLAMGWKVGEIQERITPIVAEKYVESENVKVRAGSVAGIRQVAKGILAGQELVVLDLRIYVGAQNPHDSIIIEGVPPIDMTIKGGVHGDRATPAIIVNSIPRLEFLQPGLRTMIDLPALSPRLNLAGEDRSVILKTF